MGRLLTRLTLALVIASAAFPALAFTAAAQEAPKLLAAQPVQVLLDQGGRYVAGKATVVVVILDAPVASDATTQKVVVRLGGAPVATLAPLPSTEPRRTLEFSCPSLAACGGWKAGDYTFEVTVGATTQTTAAFTFKDRGVMNILAMPIKQSYGPGDIRTVDESWKKTFDFTRRTFPLAPENVKITFGPELDLSADRFNILTEEGMNAVAEALTALQAPDCALAPVPAGITCYKKVMGFVKNRHGPSGSIQGYASGFANVVTVTDEDAEATVAHEIAHGYELGDEYQGGSFHCRNNPTPAEYVGKDWFDRGNTSFKCTASTRKAFPYGGTGSMIEPIFEGTTLIPTNEGPYEVGGRRFMQAMVSFMGSGAQQVQNWITKDLWVKLFDSYDPVATASAVDAQATPTRYVRFAGEIDTQDRVDLQPWTSFTSARAAANTTGTLFVRAVDAGGSTLATSAIAIEPDPPEGIPNWDYKDFIGSVAYPTGTSKFEVVKGTRVLATVRASANAPVVSLVSPKAGDKPTGETNIAWTATDADGDKLYTLMEYSADNGKTWLPFEGDITGNSLTIDFTEVGGTGKAESLIRVTVTDGINATAVTSGAFTVTAKAPLAEVHFPETYSEVQSGAAVFLYGEGLDLLDDVIASADRITWSSDKDGALGSGDLIETTKLSPGTHRITMTVTNSIGLKATASVTVVVHAAGRKATAADVYNVYQLYLGRQPSYPSEVVGWVGHDFGFLVDEVSWSLEAILWLDAGNVIEPKSPYTGLRIGQ